MDTTTGAGIMLPTKVADFISVRAADRPKVIEAAELLRDAGFAIYSTEGTGGALRTAGIETKL